MFCGACYTSQEQPKFHVHQLEDEGADGLTTEKERLTKRWSRKNKSESNYMEARDGDHTLIPFECDLCIFRKLRRSSSPQCDFIHSPSAPFSGQTKASDELLMSCIRRMNLDAFWSRARSTVDGQRSKLALGIKFSGYVGLDGPYVHMGPLPSFDHCGYETAIQMLLYSLGKGRHSSTHTQFETIRKLRTAYRNQVRSSPQSTREVLALADDGGPYMRISNDPCGSMFFQAFMKGMQHRMGQLWKPNKAMSTHLILRVLLETEKRIDLASTVPEVDRWITFNAFAILAYVLSLRGNEVFFVDLKGLWKHWDKVEESSEALIISLRGKIKGEHQERNHLFPCVACTSSGIDVKLAVRRCMDSKRYLGFVDGPLMCHANGTCMTSRDIDGLFHEVLEDTYDSKPSLFPSDIDSKETLRDRYHAFRSFRRSSDTRAIEKGVSQLDIEVINRWKFVKKSKGKRPKMKMSMHYAQVDELWEPFIRYTNAM